MSRNDGGQAAARGFHFQYLVTVERLLAMLDGSEDGYRALYVESSDDESADPTNEQSIDLALAGSSDGMGRLHVQVKSVEDPDSAPPLGSNEALREFVKLIRAGDAERYELVTNRRLSSSGERVRDVLEQGAQSDLHDLIDAAKIPQGLTLKERSELAKCRIVRVVGTTSAYRKSVSVKIRAARTSLRLGTGAESSGLMTGYLVDRVFLSAAAISSRRISRDDVAQWLGTSPQEIATVLGDYDWGNTIGAWPSMPLLLRPDRRDQIQQALQEQRASRRPARVVLRGPSGIGKSSIVADYAYANHDQYEFMAWINGEDADTLRSSFAELVNCLAPGEHQDRPITPGTVTSVLSRRVGRWLLVVDNAMNSAEVEQWLPPHGEGDILLTTLDGTSWTGRPSIEVGPLTEADSVKLLTQLLSAGPDERQALVLLANELGHWPLALAMSAAYISGSQMPLEQATDDYLQRLAPRVVTNDRAIPEGYPHTLADAIYLAVDSLGDGTPDDDEQIPPSTLARAAIYTSSFFSEADIPLHLLLSATFSEPSTMVSAGIEGPATIAGGDVDPNEVVRLLRTRSLIQRRQRPVTDDYQQHMSDCVSVNAITQSVLRSRMTYSMEDHELAASVVKAAYHVDQWLRHFIDEERFQHILALTPHAARIAGHAMEGGYVAPYLAFLNGNLALSYVSQGLHTEANSMLEYELLQLAALKRHFPEANYDVLLSKTKVQLLASHVTLNAPLERLLTLAQSGLADLERAFGNASNDNVSNLATIAGNYLSTLTQVAVGHHNLQLNQLINDARELMESHPTTDALDILAELHAVNNLIAEGDDEEAAQRARSALHSDLTLSRRIEFVGLLSEALGRMKDFDGAAEQVAILDDLASPREVFANEAVSKFNNIGSTTIPTLVNSPTPDAVHLLETVLAASNSRLDLVRPETLRSLYVLHGVLAFAKRDPEEARQALDQIDRLPAEVPYGVRSDAIANLVIPLLRRLAQ